MEKDKEIQKILNKFISDEWFAGNIYKQFVLLVDPKCRGKIAEQMASIAEDELNDHFKNLVSFAFSYGYTVPANYADMKKFADHADVKLFETCKQNQGAMYYVEQGIESEKRAIEAYEKYVDDDKLRIQYPELDMIIKNNYYDEVQHLEDLNFIKSTLESMTNFG